MYRTRFVVLIGLILMVAALRLLPHPPNFAPIGAMALFGGACFADKRVAFLAPLLAMLASDLAIGLLAGDLWLGLHPFLPFVYGSFALIVCLGFWLRQRRSVVPIAAAVLTGAVLFFVLTNIGQWYLSPMYSKTWAGLGACYVAAVPFFHNTLLSNAVYATLLFGGLALVEKSLPALREPALAAPK